MKKKRNPWSMAKGKVGRSGFAKRYGNNFTLTQTPSGLALSTTDERILGLNDSVLLYFWPAQRVYIVDMRPQPEPEPIELIYPERYKYSGFGN